jgi:hypothetical protein
LRKRGGTEQTGAALLAALAFLVLFSLLGGAYLRGASIDADRLALPLQQERLRQAAFSGIEAAAGILHGRPRNPREWPRLSGETFEFELPTYERDATGSWEPTGRNSINVTVRVTDLSGLLNINYAPASALQAVLALSGEEARQLRARLDEEGPLAHPDFLPLESRSEDAQKLLTAWYAPGEAGHVPWFNVNAAAAPVLGALLRIPAESAMQITAQGIFTGRDDLEEALRSYGLQGSIARLPAARAMAFVPQSVRIEASAQHESARNSQKAHLAAVVWLGGSAPRTVSIFESEESTDE